MAKSPTNAKSTAKTRNPTKPAARKAPIKQTTLTAKQAKPVKALTKTNAADAKTLTAPMLATAAAPSTLRKRLTTSTVLIAAPLLLAIVFSLAYFQYQLTAGKTGQCRTPFTKFSNTPKASTADQPSLPVIFSPPASTEPLSVTSDTLSTPAADQTTTVNPEDSAASNQALSVPAPAAIEAAPGGAAAVKKTLNSQNNPRVEIRTHNLDLFKF